MEFSLGLGGFKGHASSPDSCVCFFWIFLGGSLISLVFDTIEGFFFFGFLKVYLTFLTSIFGCFKIDSQEGKVFILFSQRFFFFDNQRPYPY